MAGWFWLKVSHKVDTSRGVSQDYSHSKLGEARRPPSKNTHEVLARVANSLSCWLPHRAAHTGQPACSRADDHEDAKQGHTALYDQVSSHHHLGLILFTRTKSLSSATTSGKRITKHQRTAGDHPGGLHTTPWELLTDCKQQPPNAQTNVFFAVKVVINCLSTFLQQFCDHGNTITSVLFKCKGHFSR